MIRFEKRELHGDTPLTGMPEWMSDLLRARGVDTDGKAERFLHPSLEHLHDPFLMKGMEKAVELIRGAVRDGRKIVVYGDYDADGVCASAIMTETLREMNADVSFRIPSRHQEGYGLNENAVREMAEAGTKLLITVDCGITSVKETAAARELGMQVIITDHHHLPEELPDADAVLDPLIGNYPCRYLCGAGVALKICQALLGAEGMEKRLDIAALATVADVVPLLDENRIIVREGMARMNESGRTGIRALMKAAGISEPVRSEQLAFRLGPRINAAGRLETADQAVELLLTEDPAVAKAIAEHLEENNRTRQSLEQQILKDAMVLIGKETDFSRDRIIIAAGADWNTGLIGLAAGKICEKYYYPVIVFSIQGENATGSCRSIPGVDIYKVLSGCADMFLRFGGHEQAAGLTLPAEKLPELKERINRRINELYGEEPYQQVVKYDAEMPFRDATLDTVRKLEMLEPAGCENPAPVFLAEDTDVQQMRRVGQDRSHLKLSLLDRDGTLRDGIAFSMGDEADRGYTRADVLYTPAVNEYRGRISVQLMVSRIRPSEQEAHKADNIRNFRSFLKELSGLPANDSGYSFIMKQGKGVAAGDLAGPELTREGLLRLYRLLSSFAKAETQGAADPDRLAMEAQMSTDQLLAGLEIFAELGLAEWEEEPFRIVLPERRQKKELEDSPLFVRIRELREERN